MKSSYDQLKERGYFKESDLEKYLNLSEDELFILTKSEIPQKRAIAISLLQEKNTLNTYTSYFLELLKVEKKLYVKLELTKALEKGDIQTAKSMIIYLNKIPNNQYKTLPNKVSKKKTYLIPRDLIGRTLSKMDIVIFPLVLELLSSKNLGILSESIDIFGFMIFHNQELATQINFNLLVNLFEKYKSNELITWKIIMAFAAFRIPENISFLNSIGDFNNDILNLELKRSLFLINKYMD